MFDHLCDIVIEGRTVERRTNAERGSARITTVLRISAKLAEEFKRCVRERGFTLGNALSDLLQEWLRAGAQDPPKEDEELRLVQERPLQALQIERDGKHIRIGDGRAVALHEMHFMFLIFHGGSSRRSQQTKARPTRKAFGRTGYRFESGSGADFIRPMGRDAKEVLGHAAAQFC